LATFFSSKTKFETFVRSHKTPRNPGLKTEEIFSVYYNQQATISATEAENALVSGRWEEAKEKYILYSITLDSSCVTRDTMTH
jgi:hypothetical protein